MKFRVAIDILPLPSKVPQEVCHHSQLLEVAARLRARRPAELIELQSIGSFALQSNPQLGHAGGKKRRSMGRPDVNSSDSSIEQFQKRVRQGVISLPLYAEFRLAKTYVYELEDTAFSLRAVEQVPLTNPDDLEFAYDLLWLVLLYKRNKALRDAEFLGRELRASFKSTLPETQATQDACKTAESCGLSMLLGVESPLEPTTPNNLWIMSVYQWIQWRRLRDLVKSVRLHEGGKSEAAGGLWTIPQVVESLRATVPSIEKMLRILAPTASTFRKDAMELLKSSSTVSSQRQFHLDWNDSGLPITTEQHAADSLDNAKFFNKSHELLSSVETVELFGIKGYLLKQFWKFTHHEWLIGLFNNWTRKSILDPVSETLTEAISVSLLSVLKQPDDDAEDILNEDLDNITPLLQDSSSNMGACVRRARQVALQAATQERWEEASFWGLLGGQLELAAARASTWEEVLFAISSSLIRSETLEHFQQPGQNIGSAMKQYRLLDKMPSPMKACVRACSELMNSLRGHARMEDRGDAILLSLMKSMTDHLTIDKERWHLMLLTKLGLVLTNDDSTKLDHLLSFMAQGPPGSPETNPKESSLSQLTYMEAGMVMLLMEYDASVMNNMTETETDMHVVAGEMTSSRIDEMASAYIKTFQDYRILYGAQCDALDSATSSLQFAVSIIDVTSEECQLKLLGILLETEMRVLAGSKPLVLSTLGEAFPTTSSAAKLLDILRTHSFHEAVAVFEVVATNCVKRTVRFLNVLDARASDSGELNLYDQESSELTHESLLEHQQSLMLIVKFICRYCDLIFQDKQSFEQDATSELHDSDAVKFAHQVKMPKDYTHLETLDDKNWAWLPEQRVLSCLNKACSLVSLITLCCSVMENSYFERLREEPMSRKRMLRKGNETSPFRGHSMWGTSARLARDSVTSERTESSIQESTDMAILWDQPLVEADLTEVVRPVWIPLRFDSTAIKVAVKTSQLIERFVFQTLLLPSLRLLSSLASTSQTFSISRTFKVSRLPRFPRVDFEVLRHQELRLKDPWSSMSGASPSVSAEAPMRRLAEFFSENFQDIYWGLKHSAQSSTEIWMFSPLPLRQLECILAGQLLSTTITRCGCVLCERISVTDMRSRWGTVVSTWLESYVRPRALCQMWPAFGDFEKGVMFSNHSLQDQTPIAVEQNDEYRSTILKILHGNCLSLSENLASISDRSLRAWTSGVATGCSVLRRKNVELQRQFITVLFAKFVRILSASPDDETSLKTCQELAQQCDDLFACAVRT